MSAARRFDRDHADRDAVLSAFALTSPYVAAQTLGLRMAPRSSPRARSVRVCCPWHGDKSPSCDVTLKRGRLVAHCHACHEGGDVLRIVAALEGLHPRNDFAEVLTRAAVRVGVDIVRERREEREPRPATPLDLARQTAREASREAEQAREDAREAREALALREAEHVARVDGLEATIAGLSSRITTALRALPALRVAAQGTSRAAVLAAVEALAGALEGT